MTDDEVRAAIVTMGNRVASSGIRNVPADRRPVLIEWHRALGGLAVDYDRLGDVILRRHTWWPTVADVVAAAAEVVLPVRTTAGCCEDGWVEHTAFPRLTFRPCQVHTPAGRFQAWQEGDPLWMEK